MEENRQTETEEGVSLMDMFRLLISKMKYLLLALLIGAILGGCFAIWKTVGINHFGTRVEFYVNPEKPEDSTGSSGVTAGGSQYGVYGAYGRHVMDNMIKLLSSESFAEQLILNGEVLPEKKSYFSDEERNAELTEYINAAKPLLSAVSIAQENYDASLVEKATAVTNANAKLKLLNEEWIKLYRSGVVKSSTFKQDEYNSLTTTNMPDLKNAYDAYALAQDEVSNIQQTVDNNEQAWKTAKKNAYEPQNGETVSAVDKVLNLWRTSSEYAAKLSQYKSCISYSYLPSAVDSDEANNLARSFIYVNISVPHGNRDEGIRIAEDILERVKKVVPTYVSENMTVPDGYNGTNCQRISRMDGIRQTDPNYTRNQAIKYAVLSGALFFVVACVAVVIIDRSDKRVRDYEVITKLFNVPVLGVVPTIEALNEETNAKKKGARKTKTEEAQK